MSFRARIAREDGFTLPELIVVMLVIGVLAGLALPAFLGEGKKGHDATAKSELRSLVGMVEACNAEHDDYRECDTKEKIAGASELPYGAGPGQARVVSAGKKSFEVEAVSNAKTGANHRFTWSKAANGKVTRRCTTGQGDDSGGCGGGTW